VHRLGRRAQHLISIGVLINVASNAGSFAASFQKNVRRDFDQALFGINDRFGGPVVARY